ncbi:MAG: phosphoribosylaminoimidazolesuccinocarboxamide synthase [Bacteroidales bacterium]
MGKAIVKTDFNFEGQKSLYTGKVRDVYNIDNRYLVMVVSDRISAFDVVLPKGIPYKGQVLNQIATKFLDATSDLVPNWKIASPDPMVTVGRKAEPFKVEMVVRAYLTGHAWREYRDGKRSLCGVPLPEGLKEHDRLPEPIITPTTKADEGHDEDISREEIISTGLVNEEDYKMLEDYSLKLFKRGTDMAREKGLILVDTKYEFGTADDEIILIDEINTPDSSRYFYLEGYEDRQAKGEQQKQLSKEFVRQWLISNGFQGKEGQEVPEMPEDFVNQVSERYIELFENITGENFHRADISDIKNRIFSNVSDFLKELK